jgi:ribosomal protein S24E
MDIEILSKKENQVIDRIELEVLAKHLGAPTPKREEIRELVAGAVRAEKDRVIVDHLETGFGHGMTRAYVKVYPSKKRALEVETRPILVRNKLAEPKPKAEKAKAAPPPGKPKGEAKVEAKAETKPKAEAKPEGKADAKSEHKADAKADTKHKAEE